MLIRVFGAILLTGWLCSTAVSAPVTIQFNYDFDTNGFFDDPFRRELLELAADSVLRWRDDLDAILPDPEAGNTWTATVEFNFLPNLVVPADTITVFVSGNNFGNEGTLALTHPGEILLIEGSTDWEETVRARGESGAALEPMEEDTDFGPWGSLIYFNADRQWHFGKSTDGLANNFDFLSVAMHELGHVLGVGPAGSWQDRIVDGKFTGEHALATGSPNNPDLELHNGGHYLAGTESFVAGELQTAAMDPFFSKGERKLFTDLDFSTLEDIGWDVAAPGDLNRDGVVDNFDIVQILVANSFNSGVGFGWSVGDIDGDLDVDNFDIQLILIAGFFGTGPYASQPSPDLSSSSLVSSSGSFSPTMLSVETPEPSSLALLLAGAVGLVGAVFYHRVRDAWGMRSVANST